MKKLILVWLFFTVVDAAAQKHITWPGHKKAVIVLTYDDALKSQLDVAIPQLDSSRLTATFFLTGYINSESIPRWRKVSLKGFELANHTLYHPCLSDVVKSNPANASENYSVYAIIREIAMMNNFLFAIDGKTTRTFAYPCTETKVGGISYVDSLKKSGLVKYARIGGDENAVVTDFERLDPLLVPAWGVTPGRTGKELIAFVKKVEESGGLGVFMFHGIGGDYLTTPAAAHNELVAYLQKHSDEIWVTTFQQAMDYVEKAK